MATRWQTRRTSDELRRRYLADGWWTDETLGQLVDRLLVEGADRPFRVWSDSRPFAGTIAQVHDAGRRLAAGLVERGIGPGDVVAFQLPNCAEAAAVFWGVAQAGATIVPIVHFYGPHEVGYILRQSGARVVITADAHGHLDHRRMIDELRPGLPDLDLVVTVAFGDRPGDRPVDDLDGLSPLLADAPLAAPVEVDPDDAALVAYTSGTTADPKGVIHSHRSLVAEITQLASIQPADRLPLLVGAPVGHAIGMLAGLLLPLQLGDPIHLTDGWDPDIVLPAMLAADLNAGSGATFFLTSLLDAPGLTNEHLARMRHIGLGGSSVPDAVVDRAAGLGISIIRSYGSTEHPSTTGATHDDPLERRGHTDGRALPGVEVRIVDDAGRDCEPGVAGEILSRGPDLFAGYTDRSLTVAAFVDDGWYATGDIGVVDADGWLRITDRKKDIIIRGGENISAAEVEGLLQRLPGVAEVAVVAAPDERLGEHACAFMRLVAGHDEPDLVDVQNHLDAAGLARQKWPEELHLVDDLPRTASGKVKKYELRARLHR